MIKSDLATIIVPASRSNYTKGRRNYRICKFTPHHMAGILDVKTCGKVFQNSKRRASANYGIGNDGTIACYVGEEDRAWTSGSRANDYQAITVEVSNCEIGGEWKVSDAAWESLVRLAVDVCRRYNFRLTYDGTPSGSLTRHNMFARTTCPGPYLQSRFDELALTVNGILDGEKPTPVPCRHIGDKVRINGIFTSSSSTDKLKPAREEGIITKIIAGARNPYLLDNGNLGWTNDTCIIDTILPPKKSAEEVAKEILYSPNFGGWGTGAERRQNLINAGYNPDEVQSIINDLAAGDRPIEKPIEVGDVVKIKADAQKYVTGQTIPSWVKKNSYKVIQKTDEKALLDSILSWVYIKDIYKI